MKKKLYRERDNLSSTKGTELPVYNMNFTTKIDYSLQRARYILQGEWSLISFIDINFCQAS